MNRKITCVTGSSRGIGKAISESFAAAGYDIVLNCQKDVAAMEQVRQELEETYSIRCFPLAANVSDSQEVLLGFQKVAEEFGEIDVLINNAGISYFGLLSDMTFSQWQQVLNTNLSSAFYCAKQVIPAMVRRKHGRIINISSIWGNCGASYETAYSAAKGGLNTLTKALAKELAPSNIPVNAISCGVIDTEMNAHLSAEERQALVDEIPACRLGTPEEVGQLTLLLAQAPTYLTGQIITMDGGLL
ncbi:MAG: SDR family NAD(P)-dependent oxidoreductase [Lachnospiraceae bacterium]|nr:SDR family NAD(P)-dependent oxidoreductase [Lachnospiraceae bacterium]